MSIQQILEVPENGQLKIQLPGFFKKNEKVKVTIEESLETKESKIALLKRAIFDKDFIADSEAVNRDFEFIESKIE